MKKDTELHFEESLFENQGSDYLELPLSRAPFLVVGILGILFFGVALLRVGVLNISRGDAYGTRASANMHREILVPAPRGKIFDSRGTLLATEEPTWSVVLELGDLFRSGDIPGVARALSEELGIPEADILEVIARANPETQSSVLLARNISTDKAITLQSRVLEGVSVQGGFRRVYPESRAFSHILGYVSPFPDADGNFGRLGVEAEYEPYLAGENGSEVYVEDVRGVVRGERGGHDAVPGDTLLLTIDAEFQKFLYDRFIRGLRDLGRRSGAAVALDPKTGRVLALVSVPSFDNALFSYFGRSDEKQAALDSSDRPFFNRAVSGIYNPGSTIKPFMALLALKERIVSPAYKIYSPGYIEVPNPYFPDTPTRFLDWKPHGWVDLRSALARSSNVYFYEVGGGFERLKGLGIGRINDYWDLFGFDRETAIDIPGEKVGFLGNPLEKEKRTGLPWLLGDTYNVAIGQGDLSLTPIRLLSFVASIGENGILYEPYVVEKVLDSDEHILYEHAPRAAFDYSSWTSELHEVQEGMKDTVRASYGTARLLADIPMSIAAKTGTAQIEANTAINAFFVGYAPANDPKVALLILVEDAREGAINTLPVARDAFLWYYENRLSQ